MLCQTEMELFCPVLQKPEEKRPSVWHVHGMNRARQEEANGKGYGPSLLCANLSFTTERLRLQARSSPFLCPSFFLL